MNKVKVTLVLAVFAAVSTFSAVAGQAQTPTSSIESESNYAPLMVIPAQRPSVVWSDENPNRKKTKLISSGFHIQEESTPGLEDQDDAAEADSKRDIDDLDAELRELKRDLEDEELNEPDDDIRQSRSQPFGMWPKKSIREVRVNINEQNANSPEDQSGQLTNAPAIQWAATNKVFAWSAPNIRYQPLYFEDVALERYGQTQSAYRQSFYSAARFLKSSIALPYAMTVDAPGSCDGPLGFCRPGSQTSCVKQIHFFSR